MANEVIEVKIQPDTKDWQDHAGFYADIATPIVTLIIGILLFCLTKKFERSQWRSQKVIEKRIIEWDKLRSDLNDIFCFCMRVGAWKSLKPTDVIKLKRIADRTLHLARPYFSEGFFKAYISFIQTCFAEYQGHAIDAKIKSPLLEHKDAHDDKWDSSWDELFFERSSTEEELRTAYETLLAKVTEELETRHK